MTNPTDPTASPPPGPPPTTQPSVPWEAPPDEGGPAPGVRFANHGTRLVAYIIDSLIIGVGFVAVFIIAGLALAGTAGTGGLERPSPGSAAAAGLFVLLTLVLVVVAFAYFPFFWARSGQTPGMRPFGLYVVRDSDGGKISGAQAVLRLIGLWVSAIPLYLGYIWIFIDKRRRGWHDLISGTVMIERQR